MSTIKERVERGAALLDVEEKGWEQKIDLDSLNLQDPCRCVLGQLFVDRLIEGETEGYHSGLWILKINRRSEELGFNHVNEDYTLLTRAWKALIRQRRAEAPAPEPRP